MSPTTTCNGPASLDLSRGDAWVLHAALTDWIDAELDEGRTPRFEAALLGKVESCDRLTAAELRVCRQVVNTYRADAPEEDADALASVAASIDAALASA
jgi:hypothetical protein